MISRHPWRPLRRALLASLWVVCAAGAGLRAQAADLRDLITVAKRSVVAVGTYNALDNPRFTFRGTGFAVGDGSQLITNHHVLPGADLPEAARLVVMVAGPGGALTQLRDVQVRSRAPDEDLALLSLAGSALPPLPLAADALAREGQPVALIGFPLGSALGLSPVTHRGIVSAVTAVALPPPSSRQLDAKTLNRLRSGAFDIYQLDATAYPGNSGSPLLDAETGQVLGIVNMVFVKGTRESVLTAPSGISYAIPVRHVQALLQAR